MNVLCCFPQGFGKGDLWVCGVILRFLDWVFGESGVIFLGGGTRMIGICLGEEEFGLRGRGRG